MVVNGIPELIISVAFVWRRLWMEMSGKSCALMKSRNQQKGEPRKVPLFGERRSRDARTRHTNRICLPSTANDDAVSGWIGIPSGLVNSLSQSTHLSPMLRRF